MSVSYLTETPEGVILNVRAQPRSSCSGLDGLLGDAVKVRIRCAPVDGKANKELIETLADAFDLPKSSVVFKSGETSKTKRILLRGKTAAEVRTFCQRVASFCIALFLCCVSFPFVSCVAAESLLDERLREFHALRLRRESMHYREYNKEVERQWEELGRILCEVQKEVAQGEVSDRCKMLFRDDVIAAEAFARMLPGLRKLTVREQKKALGALISATDVRTRGKVLVTMLFSNLPLEAFKEDAVQSCLVSILRDGRMAGGALYFFVEDSRWGDVADCARGEARCFNPRVEDSDENLCALLCMSALARHGDKTACECLNRCFKDRRIESNRDLFFLCPILLLARDEALAKDVLGLIAKDQVVRCFGEDCVPRASSFAHAAASACSQLIVGFPTVREGCDYVGAVKEDAEKWIVENRKLVFVEDFRRCLDTGCRLRREYRRCLRAAERSIVNR